MRETAPMAKRGDLAEEIHASAVIVDTVNRSRMDDGFFHDIKVGRPTLLGRTILVSSEDVFSPFGFKESLRDITETLQIIKEHPSEVMLVKRGADIQEAKETGRTGLYLYFQSPEPLATQLWRLHLFYELGLRVLQLTYNERSLLGDGCAERTDAGLTEWGVEVVEACNELGIAVDVSHSGYTTTMEAIEVSRTPVLLTHANSRSLCDNRRCKTDEQVKTCAAKGGVVGVQALPSFISNQPGPTIEGMLDHIDHYVEVVGVDHVGLGLDLTTGHERDNFGLLRYKPEMYQGDWVDGVLQRIPGLATLADLPNITTGLVARGYGRQDIMKILGGNFARVLGEIWG
jgi:membrane dipeptidase